MDLLTPEQKAADSTRPRGRRATSAGQGSPRRSRACCITLRQPLCTAVSGLAVGTISTWDGTTEFVSSMLPSELVSFLRLSVPLTRRAPISWESHHAHGAIGRRESSCRSSIQPRLHLDYFARGGLGRLALRLRLGGHQRREDVLRETLPPDHRRHGRLGDQLCPGGLPPGVAHGGRLERPLRPKKTADPGRPFVRHHRRGSGPGAGHGPAGRFHLVRHFPHGRRRRHRSGLEHLARIHRRDRPGGGARKTCLLEPAYDRDRRALGPVCELGHRQLRRPRGHPAR